MGKLSQVGYETSRLGEWWQSDYGETVIGQADSDCFVCVAQSHKHWNVDQGLQCLLDVDLGLLILKWESGILWRGSTAGSTGLQLCPPPPLHRTAVQLKPGIVQFQTTWHTDTVRCDKVAVCTLLPNHPYYLTAHGSALCQLWPVQPANSGSPPLPINSHVEVNTKWNLVPRLTLLLNKTLLALCGIEFHVRGRRCNVKDFSPWCQLSFLAPVAMVTGLLMGRMLSPSLRESNCWRKTIHI